MVKLSVMAMCMSILHFTLLKTLWVKDMLKGRDWLWKGILAVFYPKMNLFIIRIKSEMMIDYKI